MSGYGLWPLVVINVVIFAFFAMSFFKPKTRRDWKAMGAFSAFLVALFTEMYGIPLTIYLLAGVLGGGSGLDLTHNGGHLWAELIGWKGDPHLSPFHMASWVLIGGGFWLMSSAWQELWRAARADRLATPGPYAYVRHPQYDAFILVMIGFLFQWPTILTLIMFPILVVVYVRLARGEERAVRGRFGSEWDTYAGHTPGFIPRAPWSRNGSRRPGREGAGGEDPCDATATGPKEGVTR